MVCLYKCGSVIEQKIQIIICQNPLTQRVLCVYALGLLCCFQMVLSYRHYNAVR